MKKRWLRIVCILLAAVCLLALLIWHVIRRSVNLDNYTMVDYNLLWVNGEYRINTTLFGICRYYKIDGIPFDEYVACEYRPNEMMPSAIPLVIKRNDFEGTLSYDTTSAKIFIGEDYLDGRFDADKWIDYGKYIVKNEVALVEEEITEQIVKDISAKENCVRYQYFLDRDEKPQYLCNEEMDRLRIKIPIKEYDNLLWVTSIVKAGDHYYFEIFVNHHWELEYLPCSDEFAAFIDDIVVEYGLSLSA